MKPTTAPNCFSSSALLSSLLLGEVVDENPVLFEDAVVMNDGFIDDVVEFADSPPPIF